MLVVVDYNLGNVGSILNMLKKVGVKAIASSEKSVIGQAEKLILPGVGAFDQGMENLNRLGLIPLLTEKVVEKRTPFLGICLGMQLLTQKSEEGKLDGLGWVNASTVYFKSQEMSARFKVPHMGWNYIKVNKRSGLIANLDEKARFYFVHSFHLICNEPSDILMTTQYGYGFPSAIQRHNIYGVQFHPEKSHRYGMLLLKNFSSL